MLEQDLPPEPESGEQTIACAAKIVKCFEGFSSKAYKCPAGVWTVGFGRTGTDVGDGVTTTVDVELEWLNTRLEKTLVWIRNTLRPLVLNSNQEAALISLVYNIGEGNFKVSSVYRMLAATDNGDTLPLQQMKACWLSWNKAGGKVQPGLVRRRQAEWDLFTEAE